MGKISDKTVRTFSSLKDGIPNVRDGQYTSKGVLDEWTKNEFTNESRCPALNQIQVTFTRKTDSKECVVTFVDDETFCSFMGHDTAAEEYDFSRDELIDAIENKGRLPATLLNSPIIELGAAVHLALSNRDKGRRLSLPASPTRTSSTQDDKRRSNSAPLPSSPSVSGGGPSVTILSEPKSSISESLGLIERYMSDRKKRVIKNYRDQSRETFIARMLDELSKPGANYDQIATEIRGKRYSPRIFSGCFCGNRNYSLSFEVAKDELLAIANHLKSKPDEASSLVKLFADKPHISSHYKTFSR